MKDEAFTIPLGRLLALGKLLALRKLLALGSEGALGVVAVLWKLRERFMGEETDIVRSEGVCSVVAELWKLRTPCMGEEIDIVGSEGALRDPANEAKSNMPSGNTGDELWALLAIGGGEDSGSLPIPPRRFCCAIILF